MAMPPRTANSFSTAPRQARARELSRQSVCSIPRGDAQPAGARASYQAAGRGLGSSRRCQAGVTRSPPTCERFIKPALAPQRCPQPDSASRHGCALCQRRAGKRQTPIHWHCRRESAQNAAQGVLGLCPEFGRSAIEGANSGRVGHIVETHRAAALPQIGAAEEPTARPASGFRVTAHYPVTVARTNHMGKTATADVRPTLAIPRHVWLCGAFQCRRLQGDWRGSATYLLGNGHRALAGGSSSRTRVCGRLGQRPLQGNAHGVAPHLVRRSPRTPERLQADWGAICGIVKRGAGLRRT